MAAKAKFRPGESRLVGIIGDEDTVTGFLLAGVGDMDPRKGRPTNFFVVSKDTEHAEIEAKFREMTARPDIAMILICQHIANDIRYAIDAHDPSAFPVVLSIPSKDSGGADPFKGDPIMDRLNRAMGLK